MARNPSFAEPSSYIRYVGPVIAHASQRSPEGGSETKLRFIRLNAREAPLKYPFRFASVAPGARSAAQNFGDLELLPSHIAQVFVGVSIGGRARIFHPFDERVLRWDQATMDDITEDDTGNLEYEDSPIDEPSFEMWLAPTENFVPGIDVVNVLSTPRRTMDIQVLFVAAKYTYEFVTQERDPETHDKLRKFQIPSRQVTFGGKI